MVFILISIVLIANNSCLSMSRTHANQNSQDIKTKRFFLLEKKKQPAILGLFCLFQATNRSRCTQSTKSDKQSETTFLFVCSISQRRRPNYSQCESLAQRQLLYNVDNSFFKALLTVQTVSGRNICASKCLARKVSVFQVKNHA